MTTFKTGELEQVLKVLAPAVGNPTLNICENVVLSAANNKAAFRATNLNLEITTECPCDGEAIELLLPHKRVLDAISNTGAADVSIEAAEGGLTLLMGKGKLSLSAEKIELFPKMQSIGETRELAIGQDLINAFKTALKFQEANEIRPMLNGVCLHFNTDDTSDVVGTNAGYIYRKTLPYKGAGEYHLTANFVNAIKNGNTLVLNEKHVGVKDGDTLITALLNDQKYVNYLSIYNKKVEPNVSFVLADLLPELNMIIAQQIGNRVPTVNVSFDGNLMNIGFNDADTDSKYDSYIFCNQSTSVAGISFNAKYLKEILVAADSEEIQMMITEHNKAVYIVAPGIINMISPSIKA